MENNKAMTKNESMSVPVVEGRLTMPQLIEAINSAELLIELADQEAIDAEDRKSKARKRYSDLLSQYLEMQGVSKEDAKHQKYVWSRYQRIQGTRGEKFDFDRFEQEQADLYSELVGIETEVKLVLDEERAEEMIASNPALLALLQEYTIPGTPYSYIKKAPVDKE